MERLSQFQRQHRDNWLIRLWKNIVRNQSRTWLIFRQDHIPDYDAPERMETLIWGICVRKTAPLLHFTASHARRSRKEDSLHPEGYEFIEGQDCLLHKFVEQLPSGAKHCIEYLISLDMAKELAMEKNNERGRQARQYFIEVKKRYRHTEALRKTICAALTPNYPRK